MARKNDVVQYAQHSVLDAVTSGVHIMGPFAVNGVSAVAVYAEFASGTGVGSVQLQRAGQPLGTPDDQIQWRNAGSAITGNGEIQSGLQQAMMCRVVVAVASGTIQINWVAGARNV